MKKNNKLIVSLGILLAGVFTFGALSSSAIDPLTSDLNRIKINTEINNKAEEKVLVQVGNQEITNTDVLNYKEYNRTSQSNFTDSEVLEHMIKEELFLQLAEKEGVSATLDEGRQEAKKMKDLLSQQPIEVQETHKKFIAADGVTEDEHWKKVAPPLYQELLSKQNLAEKLLNDQVVLLKESSDIALVLNQYKEQLYKSSLSDGTVKIMDKSIDLNE
ncbi:hypothetical protein J45TS6_35600 [Paenibacillus sp. J45TS6]|uniref:SurA N-terminal domain-containing protein n=1 Tax=Paenibacillus gallinarum TaxID=2762232 RepID=A0ABR8T658_9BACL|nr:MULTISPECIES: hypothetical protein [Paenibacillus]MBD7971255.1 hypothetical protein [Paenibacillus gallinarum]GIP45101.1 hypothetical protein J45TS6_35600 [Paenibacillus sp. J45TS6]